MITRNKTRLAIAIGAVVLLALIIALTPQGSDLFPYITMALLGLLTLLAKQRTEEE